MKTIKPPTASAFLGKFTLKIYTLDPAPIFATSFISPSIITRATVGVNHKYCIGIHYNGENIIILEKLDYIYSLFPLKLIGEVIPLWIIHCWVKEYAKSVENWI